MNNLIIDTTGNEIILKIISKNKEYNIKHDNSRDNFDQLVKIIFDFLADSNINLSNINNVFINQDR